MRMHVRAHEENFVLTNQEPFKLQREFTDFMWDFRILGAHNHFSYAVILFTVSTVSHPHDSSGN